MKAGFSAKVFREDLQLLISVDWQSANKLFSETETLFIVKYFPARAKFILTTNDIYMKIMLSIRPDNFEGIKEK